MSESTLATNIFSEKLGVDVCVEIEYEIIAQPNGRPDPKDQFSEGYDMVPEILGVKILEFIPNLELNQANIKILSTFEEDHMKEFEKILNDFYDEPDDDDDYEYEDGDWDKEF